MKTTLCLVFFGLIAQITAIAQDMLEVNSPTSINLNTLISVPSEDGVGAPTIYIFGDAGLGYVSKDKCKSWQQLDIDPVKKRDINLATRVNDTLLFVSGGKENDLLKYSTDDGLTFKDFILPEASRQFPVAAIIPMNNWEYSVLAFLQSNFFNLWQNYPGTGGGWLVQPAGIGMDGVFTFLGGSAEGDYVTTFARSMGSGTNGSFAMFGITTIRLKTPGYNFEIYPGQGAYDSITSISASREKGICLAALHSIEKYPYHENGNYNYEAVANPVAGILGFTNIRKFPALGKDFAIKSSLITPPHSLFWHVGGDVNGQNGFIIKEGVIVKQVPNSALNMIIDVSDNEVDAILAVGNNGKIYSTRTDLALGTPVISWTRADDFSAYPNPFNSELTVKSSSEAIATLSDILGTTLKQIRLESGTNLISLVGLKPGIYFLTNKKQTLKLIKQ
jgi:hypothetical protein